MRAPLRPTSRIYPAAEQARSDLATAERVDGWMEGGGHIGGGGGGEGGSFIPAGSVLYGLNVLPSLHNGVIQGGRVRGRVG